MLLATALSGTDSPLGASAVSEAVAELLRNPLQSPPTMGAATLLAIFLSRTDTSELNSTITRDAEAYAFRWDSIGYGGGTNLYGCCTGGPLQTSDSNGLQDQGMTLGDVACGVGELNQTQSPAAFQETMFNETKFGPGVAGLLAPATVLDRLVGYGAVRTDGTAAGGRPTTLTISAPRADIRSTATGIRPITTAPPLSFDPENRVTLFGSTVAAAYRADGLRASKSSGSGTTYFLYDGGEPIVELNSSGSVTALNVFAPDGLVARTAGETTTEYVFDQQGNVADRTDTSGTIQSITQYDGWGNEQAISGTPTDPFGYNAQWGYYLDRETGLYLCQHRFYDPANGRWLNRDPIGYAGGTNVYGYCASGPMNRIDEFGLEGDLPAAATEMVLDAADSAIADGGAGLARGAATAGAAGAAVLGADPEAPDQVEGGVCSVSQGAYGWMQQAAQQFAKKAGEEWHHLYPKYLGGPEDGPVVRLPASAHQAITNMFRELAPYGKDLLSPDKANAIIQKVYESLPLPPELFNIHYRLR